MSMGTRAAVAGLAAAMLGLAPGCGGSDEAPTPSGGAMARTAAPAADERPNQPPVVERVVLSPEEPTPDHPVEARVEVSDPDGDAVRVEFRWRVAGELVAEGTQPVIRPTGVSKGDRVEVEVIATDGRAESQVARASTRIGNRPPRLDGVFLLPEGDVQAGDELVAQVRASDPDGDDVEMEYVWLVNGEPLPRQEGPRFDSSELQRGDRVRVEVRVTDGDATTPPARSRELEITNAPPQLARIPRFEAEDGVFRHQLEASDPDGDRNLRFRLVEGPAGMTVDPVLGVLTWRPSADQVGNFPVEVVVEDSHGDGTSLRFDLNVTTHEPEPAAAAPPAAPAGE